MRIQNSTVAMNSSRSYQAEQEVSLTSIRKYHGQEGVEKTITSVTNTKSSVRELSGSESLYGFTSGAALSDPQTSQFQQARTKNARPQLQPQQVVVTGQQQPQQIVAAGQKQPQQIIAAAGQQQANDWINAVREAEEHPQVQLLRRCLDLLNRLTGRLSSSLSGNTSISRSMERMEGKISAAVLRYKETMGQTGIIELANTQNAPNGYWTRQVVSSGFVKGQEHTAFNSTGTVVTADGRTLNFGISLEMSRSFEKAFVNVGSEEIYTDPLVINMDTDAASLSDVSFYFDLDCDGTAEELPTLDGPSGFLALDKNGDGVINDGSELFGAQSGDGFADLARYDQDGNGWIDENDDVFSKLRVWTRCGSGEPKLLTLKEADVGAIFLGSSATRFGLTDSNGNEKAVVRSTGFFLKESGSTGIVQHVDFKA